MSNIGKQVQQGAHNILSKFYNKINTKEIKRTVLVGGCSYHILGTEYPSKKIDKEVGEIPDDVYLHHTCPCAYFRIRNLIWFSYRKGFEKLPNSSLTTDVGWGCTIRTMQMMIANAIQIISYDKAMFSITEPYNPTQQEKLKSLVPFLDSPSPNSPLSIHHAYMNKHIMSQNKSGCSYLAPSVVGKAFVELISEWKNSPLRCVMSSNVTLPIEQIKKPLFKPTLIFLPVVLNYDIKSNMKMIYDNKLFAGIVGGIGDRSIYIYGFHALQFLYLDPHYVQQAVKSVAQINFKSYSPFDNAANKFELRSMDINQLDEFCIFGFVCKNLHEVDDFVKLATSVFQIQKKARLKEGGDDIGGFEVLDF